MTALDQELLDFTRYRLAWNYPGLNPMQLPTRHFPQVLYAGEHQFPEGTSPFPKHANQMYTHLSTSAHVNQQNQPSPAWTQMPALVVPEPSHSTYLPSVMREAQRDDVTSASHPPYHPGLYGTYWNSPSHVASNPSWPLRSYSSDEYASPHHISQGIRGPTNQLLSGPSAHQPPSHETSYSHYPLASGQGVAGPPYFAHQSSIPSGLNWHFQSTSSGPFETGLGFRFVPPQESSRCRQRARAIEYGGLWIDEEDLLKSLKEFNGKLKVHRCLWDEDRSQCNIWVKSNKSSINAHIQKWHRGKPGGDKLEARCRWSDCRSKMLKESIARHILGVHLKELWICRGCEKKVTRKDAYMRHAAESDFEGCQTASPQITYSADVWEIDARAALDGGGRLWYADA